MADEKFSIGSEEDTPPVIAVPPGTDDLPTQAQAVIPGMENEPIPHPTSGEMVVDFEKINELMAPTKVSSPGSR